MMKIDHLNTKVMEMIEAYSKMRVVDGETGRGGDKFLRWIRPQEPLSRSTWMAHLVLLKCMLELVA